ncbi:hypothetical protein COCON_G00058150 [Conger conger]|uniref:L27 domain-containing protein n=1 Tax=Conger conger TaxID=82655 RepID=A0A9Q1I2H9_CONCO|nr:hypothetical protein COCON_G00058150 [Conger conger]
MFIPSSLLPVSGEVRTSAALINFRRTDFALIHRVGGTMYENVPAVSALERQQVLQALERLQAKLLQREEHTHSERLGALRDALHSPLLSHILTLQHSIKQLRDQVRTG